MEKAKSEFQIFDGKCPSRSQNLLGFKGQGQENEVTSTLETVAQVKTKLIPLLKILKKRTREVLSARGDLEWSLTEWCENTDKADRR